MRDCSLCGGKLDRNKRCTLCGLDNTKNDRMYQDMMNRNNCDDVPLTHVHEEKGLDRRFQYKMPENKTVSTPVQKPKTKTKTKTDAATPKKKSGCVTFIGLIPVMIATIGLIGNIAEDVFTDNYIVQEEEYVDYYDTELDYEALMPETGDEYYATLKPGIYKIGTDIPEGTYELMLNTGDYTTVEIYDVKYGYYDWESVEWGESTYDVYLFDSGYILIQPGADVDFITHNAQPMTGTQDKNVLTETITFDRDLMEGTDFEAGVYDIVYMPSEGQDDQIISVQVITSEGFVIYIIFDAYYGEQVFLNLSLPEGSELLLPDVELKEGETLQLRSSELVRNENLEDFYYAYW